MAIQGRRLHGSTRDELLSKMEGSQIEFYLHGSQYTGNAGATSDWDFFCEDGEESINFLLMNGFKPIRGKDSNNVYIDCLTKSVMHHESGIDVSLVEAENIEIKKLMRTVDCGLRKEPTVSRSFRLKLYRQIAEELKNNWDE